MASPQNLAVARQQHRVETEPNWWKPFEMYSLGSMLWQLGIPMILFAVFNKKIAASAGPKYFNGEEYPDIVDNGFNS